MGLLEAMRRHGLDAMAAETKHGWRDRILAGPPFTADEKAGILAYCMEDVRATARLLEAALVDLPRALVRGRYAWACGTITSRGIPADVDTLDAIRQNWVAIRMRLIEEVNPRYGYPFDEAGSFRASRFAAWLAAQGIRWPRLDSGALDLKERTFKDMIKGRPALQALADLRGILSQVRSFSLPVGIDGRTRADLLPMSTRSGRCAPKAAAYIFAQAAWLRSLIRPSPGRALAYIDFSSEEILIAAVLSGDEAMIAAYEDGDPYVWFGWAAGLIPPDGTKATHPRERDACKALLLGTNYGMGARSLAMRIGTAEAAATDLLQNHQRTFPQYWEWRTREIKRMQTAGRLRTALGWTQHNAPGLTDRQAANFLVQATGADVLRASVLLLDAAGIDVLTTVHDAVLIEAPEETIGDAVRLTEELMAEASAIVLGGHRLRTEATVIRSGDRYQDKRGAETWEEVLEIIREAEGRHGVGMRRCANVARTVPAPSGCPTAVPSGCPSPVTSKGQPGDTRPI